MQLNCQVYAATHIDPHLDRHSCKSQGVGLALTITDYGKSQRYSACMLSVPIERYPKASYFYGMALMRYCRSFALVIWRGRQIKLHGHSR